ncbi:CatB-related O-acetyltransferase [Sporomusa acidovorans]|uniref:2,3,4,5-tetrahydropyridine-2,6-dicarboxylate N-acetyltransferase n=1 Tax=Sporomusa acidovorans (strain ATCC 49682 / DSM 3132 / Mol) TaxID=1123286 RepID=A0ABZ3J958_SPOA4|nr:CatB-related O-acetyltransferase [Sporomusa acidovorans]OZC15998.1 streptogramin A acetyltransferase [Sporomusa acidovorans DSM 3132]SDD90204.1 Acetyltransferase (isoleucine patch superfamily) [Sporomusa acidovorans]
MLSIIKNRIKSYLYIKNDPKNKNMGLNVMYDKYDFSVGKYTYGYQQFFYNEVLLDRIGSFCSIAPKVTIADMNHPTNYITTSPILYYKSRGFIIENNLDLIDHSRNMKVVIGNDVWIGTNVTILPSVKIGNGAIIGAGAVVVKDVPDYAIVVGTPAKVIKYRFEEEKIKILNQSKWWEWPDDEIKNNLGKFINNDDFFDLAKEKSQLVLNQENQYLRY